ncbi:MAG: bifunctional riboflavin kinase/FAD synthetase [Pseudomonadota bacterium]
MELIRGLHNLRPAHRGCVLTIGNFDGVHLGHQAVLGRLAEKADALGVPTTVMIFEPQPQEFFAPESAPPRLTRLREKLLALRRYSVDRVMCVRFDKKFAAMPAQAFIESIVVDKLGVRYLVVGDDFRFGHRRQGDFAMLQQAGERHGFEVVNMHTFVLGEHRVSSTRVRDALMAGDLAQAESLLGRRYRLVGRVAHGDKRGRQLGFPTANIHLHRVSSPVQGVFAVELFGIEGEPVPGVANVGTRPTVDGRRCLLEVHLLDFSGDIYGAYVQVDFLRKIRAEQRFASVQELKAQIDQDVLVAREFFRQRTAIT